ncbi:MAG: hydrogenase maturation protease [Sulfurovaceae bacterium]|nr:hydrogenase maturation protease [Sulfurovaceae bacterium]
MENINENQVALIGVGNIMFKDEGVGHYLIKIIEENYESNPRLVLVDGGILGFTLMTYFQEYPKVILVSTSSRKEPAGSIFISDASNTINQGICRSTANEAEINMMLEICSFADKMADITMISIVPEDIISVENGLSQTMFLALPELLETTLEHLSSCGIELKRKSGEPLHISSVIEKCANPAQERPQ